MNKRIQIVVTGKTNTAGASNNLNQYTELGWEVAYTHLRAKFMLEQKVIGRTTGLVTNPGREFLYNKVFTNVSTNYSIQKGVFDLTAELQNFVTASRPQTFLSFQSPSRKCPSKHDFQPGFDLRSTINLPKINTRQREYVCATYRKREWGNYRNADDNYMSAIYEIAKEHTVYLVGFGAEKVCDGKTIIHKPLDEWLALSIDRNCIFIVGTATGTMLLAWMVSGKPMIMLDFDDCLNIPDCCIHFREENNFYNSTIEASFTESKDFFEYFNTCEMLPNYERLSNGIIKQLEIKKLKKYDKKYIETRYNTYGDLGHKMAFLRLGFLIGALDGEIPEKVLDVGYGNGDFLKACTEVVPECYGSDVSGYPCPDGVEHVESIYDKEYDVVCFFDVLEHFEDIYEIRDLKTDYVLISVPECHYLSDQWFDDWKHRRPDEHIYHFNQNALINFFDEIGYKLIVTSNVEDTIRKPIIKQSNILTALFKREYK